MLTFAFAGGDDATDHMTVAGFASSTSDWDEFSKKWKARLDRDGIESVFSVVGPSQKGRQCGIWASKAVASSSKICAALAAKCFPVCASTSD